MDANTKSGQRSTNEELQIPEKEMEGFKQLFQKESILKKKQYLSAIREHNHTLLEKIKDFNEKVNEEVNNIVKKIVPKKKNIIPKFEEVETKALKQKFQEMEKYRRELQTKRSSTDSLQFLITVKKKFEIKVNELAKELSARKKEINHLKKIKGKSLRMDDHEQSQLLKLGELDIYGPQIEQLRTRVREKSEIIRAKKEEVFNLYKQNKSNKSIVIEEIPKQQQIKEDDPQLAKMKLEYEAFGKKVEILKLKKANLVNQAQANSEGVKKLQKLKLKYELLTKRDA